MYISNYQIGIIWSIGSYVESEKRLVIRHKDKYFLEQLKNIYPKNKKRPGFYTWSIQSNLWFSLLVFLFPPLDPQQPHILL